MQDQIIKAGRWASQNKKWTWLCQEKFLVPFICIAAVIQFFIFSSYRLYCDSLWMEYCAKRFIFTDFWPPLTVLIWHFLGTKPMLFINLCFLWSACFMGWYALRGKKIAFVFLFIPFFPKICRYAAYILKDTVFSFGYIFLAMFFTQKTLKGEKLNWWQSLLCLAGLFYFSMAKMQAQFVLPLIVFWMMTLWSPLSRFPYRGTIYRFLLTGILSASMIYGMKACQRFFVKESNVHFWQYVKIYDLAGMTVYSGKMMVPSFLFRHPHVTVHDVKSHYDTEWETLIKNENTPNPPLKSTESDQERKALVDAWWRSIVKEPFSYFRHRAHVWWTTLTFCNMKYNYLTWAGDSPFFRMVAPFLSIHSFALFFFISLGFLGLGIRYIRKNHYAFPLTMISAMGLTLAFSLFFCSLASTSRYLYFSWCCFLFALPFAWCVWHQKT